MPDRFEFLSPPASLQSFIKYVWVPEGRASEAEPYHHRALVDGCTQILLAYRGGFCRQQHDDQQSPLLRSAVVARDKGLAVISGPEDTFYGQLRLVLKSPEGIIIDISSPISGFSPDSI